MMTSHPMASLSADEKRALLRQILREKAAATTSFPLAHAQERLWFLDQLEPGTPAQITRVALHLRGALDRETLAQSLNEAVRRQPALRTTFLVEKGRPAQVVSPRMVLPLPVSDLRTLAAGDREVAVQREMHAEACRPFDLSQGPLLRVKLFQLDAEEHVLLLVLHRIICDERSASVLVHELVALYESRATGTPSPLAPVQTQYTDFAVAQRQSPLGDGLTAQGAYWRHRLADLPVLDLPLDRPRPAVGRAPSLWNETKRR